MARDYFLRMVEQIAAMLASILAKRNAGQIEEARQDLDGNSRRTIGLGLDQVRKLSPESVAQLLEDSGAMRPIKAVTLAELLLVEAEISDGKEDEPGALAGRVHAFCLLADTIDSLQREDQAVYREKLQILADQLSALRTHPYLNERFQKLAS